MNVEFEPWYRQEHAKVGAVLAAMSGDVDVARDATDEAFARALMDWPRVGAMASPGAWTLTVGLNLLRRHKRRRAMEQTRLASANWSAATAATMALPDHDLWAAVRRLPRRQRQAIVLRYVGDLAEHDIATVMGVHRGTVASTLAKAHRRLASLTEQHETNAEVPHG